MLEWSLTLILEKMKLILVQVGSDQKKHLGYGDLANFIHSFMVKTKLLMDLIFLLLG